MVFWGLGFSRGKFLGRVRETAGIGFGCPPSVGSFGGVGCVSAFGANTGKFGGAGTAAAAQYLAALTAGQLAEFGATLVLALGQTVPAAPSYGGSGAFCSGAICQVSSFLVGDSNTEGAIGQPDDAGAFGEATGGWEGWGRGMHVPADQFHRLFLRPTARDMPS